MPLSNSGLGNINISLPPNVASTVILEPIEGITAGNVQAGIAELAKTQLVKSENLSDLQDAEMARTNLIAAKSGENTDITSLGSLNHPVSINGTLRLPNISKFEVYQSQQQTVFGPSVGTKINIQSKTFDQLDEFNTDNSTFIPKDTGTYLINLYTDIFRDSPTPDWRVVFGLYVNEVEKVRFVDSTIPLPNGGPSGTIVAHLPAGSSVDVRVSYTNYPFQFYQGPFAARVTAIKIA